MICDRVAILNRGQLKYCGDVDSIGDFVAAAAGVKRKLVVDVDVLGEPAAVNAAFSSYDFEIKAKDNDRSFTVQLTLDNQDDVDALVDQIRSNGVSIAGMTRQHFSLEDAFLKIITQDSQDNVVVSAAQGNSGEGQS